MIPIGQLEQFEGRTVTLRVGDVWQLGGSFVVLDELKRGQAVLKIVLSYKDPLRRRAEAELTDKDWEELT